MLNRLVIDLLNFEKNKAYGFQEYIFNLLNYFYQHRDKILYEYIIIWCNETEVKSFQSFIDKFEVVGYKYSGYIKKLWLQSVLPFRYKLSCYDLLFSPGNISGLWKKCPEILTIHDLLFKRKEWMPSKMMRWQREIFIPISIKKADKIVAISKFTKEDIEYFYPKSKGKIRVIYNSFNFDKYNMTAEFEIETDFFLAISTNANYKNQITILRAFEFYCKNGGDKYLFVVGRLNINSEAGLFYSVMPDPIKRRIIWKSNVSNSELGSIYSKASCFISASKFEGLGMPVVEAMSFGLPVLLSDIPPHREVSFGKGIYFAAMDSSNLAKLMLNMDFTKRLYRNEIRDMFSEQNTSSKYVELINDFFVKSHTGRFV